MNSSNSPHPQKRQENSDPANDDQGLTDLHSDDNSLVSGLVTIPTEISFRASGLRVTLQALLELGCTRCLVSPALVEKLGFQLRWLKVPITFCQLDQTCQRQGPWDSPLLPGPLQPSQATEAVSAWGRRCPTAATTYQPLGRHTLVAPQHNATTELALKQQVWWWHQISRRACSVSLHIFACLWLPPPCLCLRLLSVPPHSMRQGKGWG